MMSYVIILGELIIGGFASYPFPAFFPDGSLINLVYVIIGSCLILWFCCLRVTCFYEDHLVLYYPLRLFARRRIFTYEEIASVVFYNGSSRYSERHLLLHLKNGMKRSCSMGYWNLKKARRVFFLLRFLKQKGVRIEGHNVRYNDLADCTEARVEMVFGTGEKYIRRVYHKDSKEDNKAFLIFCIILMLFYILLFVVIELLAV